MLNRKFTIAGLLVFIALFSRPLVQGQAIVPSDDDLKSKKKIYYIDLDRKSEETAESYIYILEQLDLLTTDYVRYFSSCDVKITAGYVAGLNKMAMRLSEGAYLRNIAELKADLTNLKINLQSRNAELKEVSTCKQEYRLGRHLHDELKTIHVLLENELSLQFEWKAEKLEEFEQYLEERQAETQKRILKYNKAPVIARIQGTGTDGPRNITVFFDPKTESFTSVVTDSNSPGGVVIVETVLIGTVPEIATTGETNYIPDLPPVPELPRAPVAVVVGRDRVQLSESGDYWFTKTLIDSSRQLSKTTPIFINNPTGNLTISGWNKNYLLVETEVIVSSSSKRLGKKFSKHIGLKLYLKHGRLYVEPVIPKIGDLSTQIVSNNVVVKVPKDNQLICKNSFGPVDILRVNGGLKLIARNSQISLRDIGGDVSVVNSDGPINASNVNGLLKLKNSSGRITVTNSSGTMELENMFAPTVLTNSVGDVIIRSVGPVKVDIHRGDVTIINKEGKTEINQIDGNLFVNNSFGPLLVQEISGDVSIENNSSQINVSNVSGRLTAINHFASISVKNLIGPIDIRNNNGNISIYLTQDFAGISTIRSTEGIVNLYLSREPNLVVTASTTSGEIKSFFPLQVKQKGQESQATHTFGNGKNQLTVFGEGSTIIFSDAN